MKFIIHNKQQTISLNLKAQTFKEFVQGIAKFFGRQLIQGFTLKYKDEEDDLVVLHNEADYEMALEYVQEEDLQALEIFMSNGSNVISKNQEEKPSSQIKESFEEQDVNPHDHKKTVKKPSAEYIDLGETLEEEKEEEEEILSVGSNPQEKKEEQEEREEEKNEGGIRTSKESQKEELQRKAQKEIVLEEKKEVDKQEETGELVYEEMLPQEQMNQSFVQQDVLNQTISQILLQQMPDLISKITNKLEVDNSIYAGRPENMANILDEIRPQRVQNVKNPKKSIEMVKEIKIKEEDKVEEEEMQIDKNKDKNGKKKFQVFYRCSHDPSITFSEEQVNSQGFIHTYPLIRIADASQDFKTCIILTEQDKKTPDKFDKKFTKFIEQLGECGLCEKARQLIQSYMKSKENKTSKLMQILVIPQNQRDYVTAFVLKHSALTVEQLIEYYLNRDQ